MKTLLSGTTTLGRHVALGLACAALHGAALADVPLTAKWIWQAQKDYNVYNQTIVARKTVRLDGVQQAQMRITADTFYRLFINDQWVNDGPCRSWPEHFQYDAFDVTAYLRPGINKIYVIARYAGCGDFHHVPKQAGLLAQLDVTFANGRTQTIVTDRSWEVAELRALVQNTPKVSIQMEPAELFDARLEDELRFRKAGELFAADAGPWKDLHARDVALMTRQPFALRTFLDAKVVKCDDLNFCLPAARLVNPGLIEANGNASCACGLATVLTADKACTVTTQVENIKFTIDGKQSKNGKFDLAPGPHLVLAFVRNMFGHDKEKALRFMNPQGFRLANPLAAQHENPWCFIRFKEYTLAKDDLRRQQFQAEDGELMSQLKGYNAASDELLKTVKTPADFLAALRSRAELMPSEKMFVQDNYWQFENRQVVGDASALVTAPAALMHETPALTTVRPSPDGDVELLYDLGEQNCGYWAFDLLADAGVVVDVAAVEYITPDGRIQFARSNRNALRYITHEGDNRYTSLKRRSGRFIFITLRNQKAPVRIRNFQLIESTYPVNAVGSFSCSDGRLGEIWRISTHTLKLCMEDTFTDCPLYEQTHWVGDARNEALLAFPVFGATDIGRRCIQLTAQSLERYPIAGCQTPSSWDVLLPAWSFLWGISTWDYYWYTGDKQFLRDMWPAVIRNLKGAEQFTQGEDLFSGPFWNMFDWTGADQNQKTVVHNSMFLIGAIDAALKEGEVLGDPSQTAWLKAFRQRLVAGVNKLWDAKKHAYPDSIRGDGRISPSTCQHTSFLSILYDIVEPENLPYAKKNLLDPPADMVRLGSPFAALYLFETLEKLGLDETIVQEIYRNYLPMLEAGATTVWESFPSGTTGRDGFPTRSHCHAWSSAPSYFLPRIILGVKAMAPAGQAIQLSPRLCNLTWASGTVATIRGPVAVAWRLTGDKFELTCSAPQGTQVEFVRNDSLAGKTVVFNGAQVK